MSVTLTGFSAQFNGTGTSLDIVWGSPNGDNTVTFFTSSGSQTVTTSQLLAQFSVDGVGNNQEPGGYLINFTVAGGFTGVKFSTVETAFEFAFPVSSELHISAVPEPSTWAMMVLGFAGVGFMAYRRRSNGPALRIV